MAERACNKGRMGEAETAASWLEVDGILVLAWMGRAGCMLGIGYVGYVGCDM